jgi:hypothetical protein
MFLQNKVKEIGIIETITGILNIIIAFPFAYFLGSLGACMSIFITRCLSICLKNLLYRKYLKFNFSKYFNEVFFKGVPMLIVPIVVGLLCNLTRNDSFNFFAMIQVCSITTIIFFPFLLFYFKKGSIER